ncbi:uncharacterized protein V6R79_015957 [Siganus canaliculatus]
MKDAAVRRCSAQARPVVGARNNGRSAMTNSDGTQSPKLQVHFHRAHSGSTEWSTVDQWSAQLWSE